MTSIVNESYALGKRTVCDMSRRDNHIFIDTSHRKSRYDRCLSLKSIIPEISIPSLEEAVSDILATDRVLSLLEDYKPQDIAVSITSNNEEGAMTYAGRVRISETGKVINYGISYVFSVGTIGLRSTREVGRYYDLLQNNRTKLEALKTLVNQSTYRSMKSLGASLGDPCIILKTIIVHFKSLKSKPSDHTMYKHFNESKTIQRVIYSDSWNNPIEIKLADYYKVMSLVVNQK